MVNKVTLLGRAGQDPTTRYTASGNAVASFSMATDEKYTNKAGEKVEKAEWHNVVAFGKLAEIIGEWVKKGQTLYIDGKLQTRDWEDKNGIKRKTTEIIAREMKMVGGGKGKSESKHEEEDDDCPF